MSGPGCWPWRWAAAQATWPVACGGPHCTPTAPHCTPVCSLPRRCTAARHPGRTLSGRGLRAGAGGGGAHGCACGGAPERWRAGSSRLQGQACPLLPCFQVCNVGPTFLLCPSSSAPGSPPCRRGRPPGRAAQRGGVVRRVGGGAVRGAAAVSGMVWGRGPDQRLAAGVGKGPCLLVSSCSALPSPLRRTVPPPPPPLPAPSRRRSDLRGFVRRFPLVAKYFLGGGRPSCLRLPALDKGWLVSSLQTRAGLPAGWCAPPGRRACCCSSLCARVCLPACLPASLPPRRRPGAAVPAQRHAPHHRREAPLAQLAALQRLGGPRRRLYLHAQGSPAAWVCMP